MGRLLKKIVNNEYAFSIVAKVFAVFTGLLFSVLYSRYMKADLRGQASVITNYAELITLILCFGIYHGYPYFRKKYTNAIYKDYINMVCGMLLVYIAVAVGIILVFRPSVQWSVMVILVPFMFATKELNYAVLVENPKLRNKASIYLNLIDIVLVLIFWAITPSNFAVCMIFLLLKELIYFIDAMRRLKVNLFSIRPTLKGSWTYIRFGIVPMISLVMMEINYKADVIMLDYFKVADAQIGIYTLGVSLAQKVWMIPDAMKDILVSKLAKGKKEDEVCKVNRISLTIVFVFVLGMIILGKGFILLLYGEEYRDAYQVILLLMVGIIGMVFYKMVYSYNVVNGHKNVNLLLLTVAAVANIIINAVTIPRYGISGAAFASTLSYLVCGIGFLVYFCSKTGKTPLDMLLLQKKDVNIIAQIFRGKKEVLHGKLRD